ncbi:MAG: fluoride efflux transporter CrcB [Duncaniella sp.]|nr:fluoride efflux transporter CrcB [Duncaniella sp.]
MTDYLAVAVGGALGCMSRYAVQQMPALSADRILPTLAVNLLGCLLIGLVATLIDSHGGYRTLRLMAVTGFLGGFTTYSTFALDTATLVRGGEVMKAFAYMAVTLAGGYGAFLIGQFSAQKIL